MKVPQPLKLHLISGKGGVGKSTLACGLAGQLAQLGKRVWLVSADPAHSIGDVLGQAVGGEAVLVGQHTQWWAWALDGEAELQRFRAQYQQAVAEITEHSSLFDSVDLIGLWNLAWPGFDEVMAIIKVSQLLIENQAEVVVLDMAPTGHAMRLLEYPDFIERLILVFESLQDKHRMMTKSFGGHDTYIKGEGDRFLETFTGLLRGLRELLADPQRTAVWVALLAEELSIPETGDFLKFLGDAKIPVGGVFVNQVLTEVGEDSLAQGWQALQQKRLHTLGALPGIEQIQVWQVPLFVEEPIGEVRLQQLFESIIPLELNPLNEKPHPVANHIDLPTEQHPGALQLPDYLSLGYRLVLMAGKGGVGKTTTSAALALRLAQLHPECRILLVSIDPAHSLGDAFGLEIGAEPMPLTPNLWGQEVEPKTTLAGVVASLREVLDGLNRENMSIAEVQTWQYLLDQPPPGLDEMAALLNVVNSQQNWDLLVLDTAPTGHLLRFLHMPQALEEWLTYLLRLWVKYRQLFADSTLADQFRLWRKQILQLQKDLTNPQYTVAIPVLNPETTVIQETVRLVEQLTLLKLKPEYLVVNRVFAEAQSPLLKKLQQRQAGNLMGLHQLFPAQEFVKVPFLPMLPEGMAGLTIYSRYL